MENKTVRFTFYFLTAASILIACWLVWQFPKADLRIAFPIVLIIRIGSEIFQVNFIAKRKWPVEFSLPYRIAKWEIISVGLVTILLSLTFFYPSNSRIFILAPLLNYSTMMILGPWMVRKNIPRFIVTEDKLIENSFKLRERNISDLHSIECRGVPKKIRILFADTYDIRIIKSQYTETELATLLQAIISRSDGLETLDEETRELLKKTEAIVGE